LDYIYIYPDYNSVGDSYLRVGVKDTGINEDGKYTQIRTGFTTPPKLTLGSLLSFALHPGWTSNNLAREKFKLANIIHMTEKGSSIDKSVIDYINEQFDPAMNW